MRDTDYAKELRTAKITFPGGSEGRVERLLFKEQSQEGIRFSWWKDGRMIPRPLDATETELLALLRNAVQEGVFSESFLTKFQQILQPNEQLRTNLTCELLRSRLVELEADLKSRYTDGGNASGVRREAILLAIKEAHALASEAVADLNGAAGPTRCSS